MFRKLQKNRCVIIVQTVPKSGSGNGLYESKIKFRKKFVNSLFVILCKASKQFLRYLSFIYVSINILIINKRNWIEKLVKFIFFHFYFHNSIV